MITFEYGDIFRSAAHVLVCPVSCDGTKEGPTTDFAIRFPGEWKQYEAAACGGRAQLGDVVVVAVRDVGGAYGTQYVVYFPMRKRYGVAVSQTTLDGGLTALRGWALTTDGIASMALPRSMFIGQYWPTTETALRNKLGKLPFEDSIKVMVYA